MPPTPTDAETLPVDRWRVAALEFRAVKGLVESGKLRPDFEPTDLAEVQRWERMHS